MTRGRIDFLLPKQEHHGREQEDVCERTSNEINGRRWFAPLERGGEVEKLGIAKGGTRAATETVWTMGFGAVLAAAPLSGRRRFTWEAGLLLLSLFLFEVLDRGSFGSIPPTPAIN